MTCAVIKSEPWADYRTNAVTHLSSHRLMRFDECPRTLHLEDIGDIPRKSFQGAEVGRAFHTLRLEGNEAYNEQYVVSDGPINPRTNRPYGRDTKKWSEWRATQLGEIIATAEDDLFRRMIALENPKATELLADGIPEVTIRGDLFGMPCQSRLDWLRLVDSEPAAIVDLKTTENLDRFEYDFKKYRYGMQMAFYRLMARQAFPSLARCPVFLIAYEKTPAARSCVFQVSDGTLAWQEDLVRERCNEYRLAMERDYWPTRFEEVREL